MRSPSHRHLRAGALLGLGAAVVLGWAGAAGASSRAAKTVITPEGVAAVVAADTATNNAANASLSVALQNSHESCLQDVLDDATYRGESAAGAKTLGGAFDQVPFRSIVPRQSSYPAFFSVLAEDRATGQPTTTELLTYVKTGSSTRWKLDASSEVLGPTSAGVSVPDLRTDSGGYAASLDVSSKDGLELAPDAVAPKVASAFSAEASSGELPSGVSAQFGPDGEADPHTIAAQFAGVGTVTTSFSAAFPAAAAGGRPSADCPEPAYRLKDGGALVTFTVFSTLHVTVRRGEIVVQPANRSALGALLAPGDYSSFTIVSGDMGVALVPPAGSKSPISVIGQASEDLTETGVTGSASSGSVASGGPSDAATIAKAVDPRLVDIDVTLGSDGVQAAGTGMVLTPSGEILTNNHVIESATSVRVTDVGNGRTYGAKVLGYDRTGDVAVLELTGASGLETVDLGSSAALRTGAQVVGVGNAGGSGGTPSYAGGSITALGQSITAYDEGDGTSEQLTGLIETDADIQPGDSGGPLLSAAGKVIGMDTAASSAVVFQQGGLSTSQGFAIPIGTALSIAKEIAGGHASATVHVGPTAFLGASIYPPGSSGFGGFGRGVPPPSSTGALIASVVPGGPAAKAGLGAGDTITSLAGHAVASPDALTTALGSEKPGDVVSVRYTDANGKSHTVTVRLGSGPPQ